MQCYSLTAETKATLGTLRIHLSAHLEIIATTPVVSLDLEHRFHGVGQKEWHSLKVVSKMSPASLQGTRFRGSAELLNQMLSSFQLFKQQLSRKDKVLVDLPHCFLNPFIKSQLHRSNVSNGLSLEMSMYTCETSTLPVPFSHLQQSYPLAARPPLI